jgi:hypothetical protein
MPDTVGEYGIRTTATRVVAPTTIVETGPRARISWGAVLGGVAMALAVQILLMLLGVAIGAMTIDPMVTGGTPEASSLGIGAGIWWIVSYAIALAVAGYVAARLSGVRIRKDGVLHGGLVWAVALLISAYLISSALGSAMSRTFEAVSGVASQATEAVQQAAPQATQALPTPDRIRQIVGDLLRPGDQAAASPDPQTRLFSALTNLATGQGDPRQAREEAVTIIAEQAQVPREVAQQRLDQIQGQLGQARETATRVADQAAQGVSTVGFGGFAALVVGLAAAMIGGGAGTRRRDDDDMVAATV